MTNRRRHPADRVSAPVHDLEISGTTTIATHQTGMIHAQRKVNVFQDSRSIHTRPDALGRQGEHYRSLCFRSVRVAPFPYARPHLRIVVVSSATLSFRLVSCFQGVRCDSSLASVYVTCGVSKPFSLRLASVAFPTHLADHCSIDCAAGVASVADDFHRRTTRVRPPA